jgi:hypothetical protein
MNARKSPSKFSQTDVKYLTDTLMFLCVLGIAGIGILLAFVIPEGQAAAGRSKYFLGVHRHQWGHIHLYLSLAFSGLIVLHIVLSWSWIKGKARQLFKGTWRAVLVLTVLAGLIIPFVFWLATAKNDPAFERQGMSSELRRGGEPSGRFGENDGDSTLAGRGVKAEPPNFINGRVTLRDVERNTGVSARDIAAKIGLPEDVSPDATLGQLRQRYGFEIQSVRDAVAELLKNKKK